MSARLRSAGQAGMHCRHWVHAVTNLITLASRDHRLSARRRSARAIVIWRDSTIGHASRQSLQPMQASTSRSTTPPVARLAARAHASSKRMRAPRGQQEQSPPPSRAHSVPSGAPLLKVRPPEDRAQIVGPGGTISSSSCAAAPGRRSCAAGRAADQDALAEAGALTQPRPRDHAELGHRPKRGDAIGGGRACVGDRDATELEYLSLAQHQLLPGREPHAARIAAAARCPDPTGSAAPAASVPGRAAAPRWARTPAGRRRDRCRCCNSRSKARRKVPCWAPSAAPGAVAR